MIKLLRMMPLFLMLYVNLYSQEPVQVFTPNAASLGQYSQIPVNYFNGLPQISIPLTVFKAKGYELPINLTYHASGNNPDAHPGWTGLGWTLHAGGMINRIINGAKDEISEKEVSYMSKYGYNNEFGYYYHAKEFQNSNWSDEFYLFKLSDFYIIKREYYTEPDEFQINIDDIQASFYIVGNNEIKIKSKNNVNFKAEIKLNNANDHHVLYQSLLSWGRDLEAKLFTYISEIIITKDNGTKYYFGGDESAIEFSFIQHSQYTTAAGPEINTNEWKAIGTANSWWLKKIELLNGEIVEFNYEKSGIPIVMSDNHYATAYSVKGDGNQISWVADTKQNLPGEHRNISFAFIQPSYLTSIHSKVTNNNITFKKSRSKELEYNITKKVFDYRVGDFTHYDYGESKSFTFDNFMDKNYYMQLDQIVEKNRRIRFNYSKDPESRLKLFSISFCSIGSQEISTYNFTYNPLELPPYNSKKKDRWGYYNNKYYGDIDPKDLKSFRSPNEHYMKAEMLTGITYPTGGQSELIYEAHDYSRIATQFDFKIEPETGIAGGLRIKEIRNKENGKVSTRKYEYKDTSGKSSGILSGRPIYYASGQQHRKINFSRWWGLFYKQENFISDYYLMQENNINQLSTTNGNHVTYSRVIEKTDDNSQTIYTYSNHDEFMDELPVSMIDNIDNITLSNSFISRELERGLLLKTEYLNSKAKIIHTEINTYNSDSDRLNNFVKSVNQMRLLYERVCRLSALKIYTFTPYLESTTTIVHDSPNGTPLTTVKRFEYNTNKLLSKISTTNSKGEEEIEVICYTGDIQGGIYTRMRDNNILSLPVEKTVIRNNKVIHSELTTYKENPGNKDFVPDVTYQTNLSTPLSSNQFTYYNGTTKDTHYQPEVEFTRYDNRSNIEEYVIKDSHVTTCTWGYNQEYPTGIFQNARNSYTELSQEENYMESVSISLNPTNLSSNNQSYNFKSSQAGTVTLYLYGELGYNWYVTGNLDGKNFNLVQIRNSDQVGLPWTNYQNAYTYKAEIYVPAGHHTLRITATDVYRGNSSIAKGNLSYSYFAQKSGPPTITGTNDIYYENFEEFHSNDVVPFGFHSEWCYKGPFTVTMPVNPQKSYTLDYRVFKDGKWNYKNHDFKNGTYTIREGDNPIDEVRVYPKDATASTYTYQPFVGLRSASNERGITESYEYDPVGRLKVIKDHKGQVIKAFDYMYHNQTTSEISPTTYRSIEFTKIFTKNDCDSLRGEVGGFITYTVPQGKFTSTISQEDANKKAYDDLMRNGQQKANNECKCESNVILRVFNPTSVTHMLEFTMGTQGNLTYKSFLIAPSEKINTSGNMLKDYAPTVIYLPRRYYRAVRAYQRDNPKRNALLHIESVGNNISNGLDYSAGAYPSFHDVCIILP